MAQYPNNPYQPSAQPSQMVQRPSGSSNKLRAAGIAMLVVGGLGIAVTLLHFVAGLFTDPQAQIDQFKGNEEMQKMVESMVEAGPIVRIILDLIWLVNSGLVLAAGYMMTKKSNFALAMVGAICAIVPCSPMDCCCLIEVGVGIWALVVLMQADVKAMFS